MIYYLPIRIFYETSAHLIAKLIDIITKHHRHVIHTLIAHFLDTEGAPPDSTIDECMWMPISCSPLLVMYQHVLEAAVLHLSNLYGHDVSNVGFDDDHSKLKTLLK